MGSSASRSTPKKKPGTAIQKEKKKQGLHIIVSPETFENVKKCWAEIHCQKSKAPRKEEKKPDLGWKEIRLFVSSTFRDFHSEREVLVKRVFPELREWCQIRKMNLIDVDLRWGIPEASTTANTIITILEELDRCHLENEGTPFFLNMLSERYGWIPPLSDIPEEIQEKYDWVENTSITHMEILHGAYRTKDPNAAFFFRDPDYLSDIPEESKKDFVEHEDFPYAQLKALKEEVKKQFPDQNFAYSGSVELDRNNKVKIVGLEDFSWQVLDFFKKAISNTYPNQQNLTMLTEEEQENELQMRYIVQHSEDLVGRQEDVESILGYGRCYASKQGITVPSCDTSLNSSRYQYWHDKVTPEDTPALAVISPAGQGKTALLSKVVTAAIQEGLNVFYHFCGSNPRGTSVDDLTYRVIKTLAPEMDDTPLKEQGNLIAQDILNNIFPTLREPDAKQLLIVLDGLDELSDRNTVDHLKWLPTKFPGKIRCVVGVREDTPTEKIVKSASQLYERQLSDLTKEERSEIVINYLGKYDKTLDDTQLELLVSHKGSSNPFWLMLASEELRVFGNFATLTQKIQDFPDTIGGLSHQILTRLVKEDDTKKMMKLLMLIKISMDGLPLSEILCILGDPKTDTPAPYLEWAQLRRQLVAFIRILASSVNESKITFRHKSLYDMVEDNTAEEHRKTSHLYLADFYENKDKDKYSVEIAYHLHKAGEKTRLVNFMRTSQKLPWKFRHQYTKSLQCKSTSPSEQLTGTHLKMCFMCASKNSAFSATLSLPNKQCCMFCGRNINPFVDSRNEAMFCLQHKVNGPETCYVCNGITQGQTNTVPVLFCSFCKHASLPKQCCKLTDEVSYP